MLMVRLLKLGIVLVKIKITTLVILMILMPVTSFQLINTTLMYLQVFKLVKVQVVVSAVVKLECLLIHGITLI